MLLEFEFRTSELNGILVSISEPQGYPSISLELVRGKVRFCVQSFVTYALLEYRYPYNYASFSCFRSS